MAAIDKPKSITSAQVIRNLQRVFNPSELFAPWIATERANRNRESGSQKRRRRNKHVQVKIGHGGTLDPLATGVLILGVGKGTKELESFLRCTKSYEAILLFGVATDSYDVLGKVLRKAPYAHITRELVEEALKAFRGTIMQRPPMFSAIRMQGKRLYEYAREGAPLPVEIQERSMDVTELELVEWLDAGSHEYKFPSEELQTEEQDAAKNVLDPGIVSSGETATTRIYGEDSDKDGRKRKRQISHEEETGFAIEGPPLLKRREDANDLLIPGGPPVEQQKAGRKTDSIFLTSSMADAIPPAQKTLSQGPPAVKLRMTVTSGFYVRSLCHDLGKAVGSLGIMSDLVRTRQGHFQLGQNVLNYKDISQDETVWAPKVEALLADWERGRSIHNEMKNQKLLDKGIKHEDALDGQTHLALIKGVDEK
jgi:tRNA pseudouridine55 synthase